MALLEYFSELQNMTCCGLVLHVPSLSKYLQWHRCDIECVMVLWILIVVLGIAVCFWSANGFSLVLQIYTS